MTAEIVGDLSKLVEPLKVEARTVILRDDYGQPFLVVQTLDGGKVFVSRAGEPDFEDALKSLGVHIGVKYHTVRVPS